MTTIAILEDVQLNKTEFKNLEELYHHLEKQFNLVELVELNDSEIPSNVMEAYKKFENSDKKFVDL